MSDITPTKTKIKPMCVICHVPLNKLETDDYLWLCPKDRSHKYQLFYEVMSYENDFSTIYSEEEENEIELAGLEGVGDPVLFSSTDDTIMKPEPINANKSKSDIKIPKYMQDSETTKVTYYREE